MIRNYTVDISSTEAYPASPQVEVPFVGRSCSVVSRHPSAIVKVSLDGIVNASVIDSARVVGMSFGTPTQQVLGGPIGIIGQKAADALKSQLSALRANGDPFRNHTGNTGPQRRAQSIPFGDIARFIGGNRPFHRLQIGG
jgi:hypothetical protein